MKKAYVKVKQNNTKSVLKRPYIAATIIGAAVCAMALSALMKEPEQEKVTTQFLLNTPTEKETETPPKLPQSEVSLPSKEEVLPPQTTPSEPETAEVEETNATGLFSGTKTPSFIKPVSGEILNAYSGTKPVKSKTLGDWRTHTGIDIKAEDGTLVVSPADGVIKRAYEDTLTGHTVIIDHGSGILSTVYNLKDSDTVFEGQTVKKGDAIGSAGNSAKTELLEDPHIHFEITKDGAYINPEDYIN